MKQEIFLAVCYHKEAERIATDCLRPVHVGRARAAVPLPAMIGDDTGDNISAKNASWCEVTALYWMWKNVSARHYGLMHYRRLFNFRSGADPKSRNFEHADAKAHRRFGWNDAAIAQACARADILLLPPREVHPTGVPGLIQTNREMYARDHHAQDLQAAEAVIARDHPAYLPAFAEVMGATQLSYGNLMIMSAPHFDRYCGWLFDVLGKLEAEGGREGYDSYQRRVWGFLSERLLNVYALHAQQGLGARLDYLPLAKGLPPQLDLDGARVAQTAVKKLAAARPATAAAPLNVVLGVEATGPQRSAASLGALLRLRKPGDLTLCLAPAAGAAQAARDLEAWATGQGLDPGVLPAPEGLPAEPAGDAEGTALQAVLSLPPADMPCLCLAPGRVPLEDPAPLLPLAGPAPLAACRDLGGIGHGRRLTLPPDQPYLDPGVAVIRPGAWTGADLRQRIDSALAGHRGVMIRPAADLFNLVLGADAVQLPLRWNLPSALFDKLRGDLPWPPDVLEQEVAQAAALALPPEAGPLAPVAAEALRLTPWRPAGTGLRGLIARLTGPTPP